jgi:uncharacterized membrane protein
MIKYFKTIDWLKLAKLTWILMAVYIALTFSVCLFKYFIFKYGALDLAIFNQVFYYSSMGRFFEFTIHPTSYLGDHFKTMILLLVPFYALFKSPLTLLFLQSLFLALATIPLYLICKKHLSPLHSLLIIVLYLFNPITLNVNLFEFHMLPMAVFFLLWTFYFYDQNKFRPFIIFAILSLLIREDVSFTIFMFGIIGLIDKKKLKWILMPIISSTIYFFIALKVIAHFSASSSYKFMVYYSWLGQTPLEVAKNFFPKIILVLQHLASVANFELILGLFLFFLFIPLYRLKYTFLSLGQFMEIALGLASGEVVLRTHYATTFIFAFVVATIFSLEALVKNQKVRNFYEKNKELVIVIIIVALLYNFLSFGPIIPLIKTIITTDYKQVQLMAEFTSQIPPDASLITGYDFLANLSSRKKLYALNYVFLGKQQFDAGDYIIPDDTQYLLINFNDFVEFNLQYEKNPTYTKYYYEGGKNLLKLLKDKNLHLKKIDQNLALWQKDYTGDEPILFKEFTKDAPEIKNRQEKILTDQFKFLGFNKEDKVLSLFFKTSDKIEQNYLIKIDNRIYPLGYGFLPTSNWQKNSVVQINFYDIPSPEKVQILNIIGGEEIDGIGSIKDVFDKIDVLGEFSLI